MWGLPTSYCSCRPKGCIHADILVPVGLTDRAAQPVRGDPHDSHGSPGSARPETRSGHLDP